MRAARKPRRFNVTAFDDDSCDHQVGFRHARDSSQALSGMSCDTCPLCHETEHRWGHKLR
jgi:hypothetical protein